MFHGRECKYSFFVILCHFLQLLGKSFFWVIIFNHFSSKKRKNGVMIFTENQFLPHSCYLSKLFIDMRFCLVHRAKITHEKSIILKTCKSMDVKTVHNFTDCL